MASFLYYQMHGRLALYAQLPSVGEELDLSRIFDGDKLFICMRHLFTETRYSLAGDLLPTLDAALDSTFCHPMRLACDCVMVSMVTDWLGTIWSRRLRSVDVTSTVVHICLSFLCLSALQPGTTDSSILSNGLVGILVLLAFTIYLQLTLTFGAILTQPSAPKVIKTGEQLQRYKKKKQWSWLWVLVFVFSSIFNIYALASMGLLNDVSAAFGGLFK